MSEVHITTETKSIEGNPREKRKGQEAGLRKSLDNIYVRYEASKTNEKVSLGRVRGSRAITIRKLVVP